MELLNSLEREWPQDEKGPVAVLAKDHQPYQVPIWDRLPPEVRRHVLQFKARLLKEA